MDFGKVAGSFFRICDWIMKLAYINVLWFGFMLLGGVILGVAPATAALFSIARKWIEGETELPIFATFWASFRKNFMKANLLIYTMLLIGAVLLFDILFFRNMEGVISQILFYVFILVFVNYLLVLLYIFPVFVYYNVPVLQYIKYAFIIALSNPLQSLLKLVFVTLSSFLVIWNSALFLFLSVAPVSMILMLISYRIFNKINQKHEAVPKEAISL